MRAPTRATGTANACAGCRRERTRRRAVEEISAAALAAMAGLALPPGAGAALPVGRAQAASAHADERDYPLPAADGVAVDRESQVILVRFLGRVYAFNLACPHESTALRWRQRDVRFQCPRHESQYRPDGTFIRGRATRNMDRFALRRDGERVVVDLGRLFRSDEQPAEWEGAALSV